MSITYTPDPSSLVELAVAAESTYGTLETPTVQIALAEPPEFGRGHQPIQGAALTSTIQKVITHHAIRGLEVPYVSFTSPLSANAINSLMTMLMGTAVASNEWVLNQNPGGTTIGVNVQRPGATGGDYFAFVGSKVGGAKLTMPLGGMPTLRLDCISRTLKNPDTSPTSFPTLAPTTTYRPFILQDSSFRHASATGGTLTGATAVKIKGFELDFSCDLLVEHNSTATHPDSITRTAFDVSGKVLARFSADWWDEWKSHIAGESSTGFGMQYCQFLLNDGTNILRMTLPVKMEIASMRPDENAYDATLDIIAAGDDTAGSGGAPTNPVIQIKNA